MTAHQNSDLEDGYLDDLQRHPTIVERDRLHQLQHVHTVGSAKVHEVAALPSFGRGKPYPSPLPQRNLYLVDFDSQDDPTHPQNWRVARKLLILAILILFSFAASLASSIFSPGFTVVEKVFHVDTEVATLGEHRLITHRGASLLSRQRQELRYSFWVMLLVRQYTPSVPRISHSLTSQGPMIFAPLSELYGRRPAIIVATVGFGIFGIGCATAKDYQTLMICRFFAGVFGACPLVVVPAVCADMFSNETRGLAVSCFSATVFCGPFTGPFVSP